MDRGCDERTVSSLNHRSFRVQRSPVWHDKLRDPGRRWVVCALEHDGSVHWRVAKGMRWMD